MKRITMTFGGYQKPASIHNQAARYFGELLTRKLGDRVSFELVGNVLDLGRKSGDLPTMVETGELSGCYMSTVRFTRAVPEFRALELPFVIRDRATLFNALDGEIGRTLRQKMLDRSPIRVLGFWDNGYRHLTNRVRPIRTPQDCRGLRIRTQMSELHGEVFRALGFEPVQADIKEFVEAIATEKFQAQDNPLTNIYNFGVHHHHRHITLSGHFFGGTLFICNAQLYRSWPEDVQTAVEEAAHDATALQRRLAAAEDAGVLKKLDPRQNAVVHLSAGERDAFLAAVEPVLGKHRAEIDPQVLAGLSGA
ncbi:MAG TPA: TRAP transporter substrate-binding protein [Burkholderiales bacterium]|nr:TRAP transporter substrate-binding protein [Burkholderiales bacterium]